MAAQYDAPPELTIDLSTTYTAKIDTSAGAITVEFYAADAPQTVNNFVFLAREGFYDGVIFHRTIPGFMIQGGDPTGTGTGGPGYNIDAEFNDTAHEAGVLSMARSQDPNSAGSQFFVCLGKHSYLDGEYTAFGRTADDASLDVVREIGRAQTGADDRPVEDVVINKVTILDS